MAALLNNTLRSLYYVVIFLNVVTGFVQYKKMDRALRIFFMFLIVVFVNEMAVRYCEANDITTFWVAHIYSICELALISIYFLYTIYVRPKNRLVLLVVIASTLLGSIDTLSFHKIQHFDNYMIVFESLLICPQALYVLYTISNRDDIPKLSNYPHFYIWRSLLIWWSATFFFWIFLIYIRRSNEFPMIYIYYIVFNILVYGSIFITFLMLPKDGKIYINEKTNTA